MGKSTDPKVAQSNDGGSPVRGANSPSRARRLLEDARTIVTLLLFVAAVVASWASKADKERVEKLAGDVTAMSAKVSAIEASEGRLWSLQDDIKTLNRRLDDLFVNLSRVNPPGNKP